jgi:hypothetical protein
MLRATVLMAACFTIVSPRGTDDAPFDPIIELQSEALTPGVDLEESRRPVHQVRLLVGADGRRGTLIFDPNLPEFDEFGELVGGIWTPQVKGKGGALTAVELACVIELVKEGPQKWLLLRLGGAKIGSSLLLATKGPILDAGPARLLVLGGDNKVKTVIALTRYGLAVP